MEIRKKTKEDFLDTENVMIGLNGVYSDPKCFMVDEKKSGSLRQYFFSKKERKKTRSNFLRQKD